MQWIPWIKHGDTGHVLLLVTDEDMIKCMEKLGILVSFDSLGYNLFGITIYLNHFLKIKCTQNFSLDIVDNTGDGFSYRILPAADYLGTL